MKILLVPWMLLLFGASLSSGHYIQDPEFGNPKVYEVREGPSGVTFVNPKPGNPTLRDILYYHIIERPREDPAATERSFTNSHGYQFLEPVPLSGETDNDDDLGHMEDESEFIEVKDTETREDEEPDTMTEAQPLTDEEVKEAYKTKSYLFDQMRQRYAVKRMAIPDSLNRKKRQAEMQPLPDAPSLSNKEAYVLPKTYGMNLNPEGGYVWNNLNKPPSYYELGPSNGNNNEGQYPTAQNQENIPLPSENAYIPPETSSEDIYVNTNRPSATPLGTLPVPANPELNNNPEPANDNPLASDSGANYPVEPVLGNGEAESNVGIANNPIGPEVYENPEQSYPVEPNVDNSGLNETPNTQEAVVLQPETPISEGSAEPVGESIENPGYGYESEREEPKPESSPEENSGDKIKEIATMPPIEDIPKTYGMNLTSGGGHVWNDMVNPPVSYDVGTPSNPDEGQNPTAQNQENIPLPSENAYIPPETSNSGSSEDIYVNTNRPSATTLGTLPEPANPELNNNPETANDNPLASDSGANYPVEPVLGNDEAESNVGIANNPIGPEVYENPEQSYPVEPNVDNSGLNESPNTQETVVPQPEINNPLSEGSAEPVGESIENPGYGYGQSEIEEPKPESSPEENSGDKIKEMPEAPTLSPLNYDNLPDYIRDAISSTVKPTSYEQSDNPYINPQPSTDDKKAMEDKMEDIFATMPPIKDIPNTYGMNLTSGGGHVWNDMVNPPVSYDVGTPSNPDEEQKEEQTQAPIIEQPEIHEEPENPIPETEEPIANPEEPNLGTHDSEETDNPIEDPNPLPEPVNEGELEEPIANPNQELPESEQEPEPNTPEIEDKPIEEVVPENPEVIPENPEVIPDLGNEGNHEVQVTEEPADVEEPGEENGDHLGEPENESVEEIPEEENNKPDIMNELLKSEQFWKWLGEWTATYMELLEKHTRKIVIQEICKREKSGEQMCPLNDNPEGTGVIIKDGKIIVDGREIDMTHTDNLDSELKRHQNNKHENKGGNENKIEASTIFGNSVGNKEVTNVFIFTADKAEELIDKLKPTNDSEVDFVIDDRIKEENKDEPNKEMSVEDESNVEESNIDDANKSSNEGAVNKDEPNNGEANKESNKGSNVTEVNTEELNSEEAKKEPNQGEAAKEEVSQEESNEGEAKDESNVSEASKEDANIESNEGVIKEDSNKKEGSDTKPEIDEEDLNKDAKLKDASGDIGELDDKADDESKQDSSEKNTSNSKDYLENK